VFSRRFRQLLHSHGHAAKEKSVPNLLRNGGSALDLQEGSLRAIEPKTRARFCNQDDPYENDGS
jgi:hypothetical protein